MNIALTAHDAKTLLMVLCCFAYCRFLSLPTLSATGTTVKLVEEATGLSVHRFLSGPQGGDQQIAARISCNEIDLLLYYRDPMQKQALEPHDKYLLRPCDLNIIPVATYIATAEVLIHGLERGDLEWRENVKL